jgi:hypothetical protein
MKQKLWKRRKQLSLSKVVLYSNEGQMNFRCVVDVNCGGINTKETCGGNDINPRCVPPKPTKPNRRGNFFCRVNVSGFC